MSTSFTVQTQADFPILIDCHAHLYPPYYPDGDEGVRALEALLTDKQTPMCTVIVTECGADLEMVYRLWQHPILATKSALCVGVHPMQRVSTDPDAKLSIRSVRMQDLDHFFRIWNPDALLDERIIGIGEIGLDFSPHVLATHPDGPEAARAEQREVCLAQLMLARRLHLPVNLHSRQAGRHILDLLREAGYADCNHTPGILLHAFDGRPRYIQEGLALGAYFSVAPSLARDTLLERLVRLVPLERLVLESDAPALGMARGEPSCPSQIRWVCQRIAQLKQVPERQVAMVTTANALRLFPRLNALLSVKDAKAYQGGSEGTPCADCVDA
jgi:TatD DNase family protein